MANQYEPQEQNRDREQNRSENSGKFQAGSERARQAGKKGGESSRGGGRRSE